MRPSPQQSNQGPAPDPLWYKQAIIYQLHVRAYADHDGDGIGDFCGLTAKLDYLQGLGVTALWLLPFYPSPLKDDGYDIADYCAINPIYGTLADFKTFLREAHRRGLRVITELVLNHTSDQHTWFQRSRQARPGSHWRNFYVWSDSPGKYREARVIFKDFETSNWTWDPVAQAYYWHRFFSHQPDLNFEHPQVHKEVFRILDFWLRLGVDGLRLDAVPYLYEREGTNCENLPETHVFLKKLRQYVESNYGDCLLLAEANQWPESAVAYFGADRGDECHMAFHFPLMPRLFMALRMEDRVPIVDILEQTPPIPETSQWAVFLRNHDELTLEMVTDEERDYMYRMYAQDAKARLNLGIRRRLAPLLGNDRKRIELLNSLLMSLPGTPVLYYGDEIGMGDNIFLGDRNSLRTPMHWSSDKNAGFSRANPQSLYLPIILDPQYHYEAVNVEAQEGNPHSLLRWMRRLLALRKKWRAFGQGTLTFLQPENRKILAFIRRYGQECLLVVNNLSRFVQPVELDLSPFQQSVPVELFGRTIFPPVTERPYFLTLGPHAFYWFLLPPPAAGGQPRRMASPTTADLPVLPAPHRWEGLFEIGPGPGVENCLSTYLGQQRWFDGLNRQVKSVQVRETLQMPLEGDKVILTFLEVELEPGDLVTCWLALAEAEGAEAGRLLHDSPQRVIARLQPVVPNQERVLYDATDSPHLLRSIYEAISHRRRFRGTPGELEPSHTPAFRLLRREIKTPLEPMSIKSNSRNLIVTLGDKFLLKVYRQVASGPHPEVEIGRFLTQHSFAHAPLLAGTWEYRSTNGQSTTLAILQVLVPNSTDGWEYTLDALGRFFERMSSLPSDATAPARPEGGLSDWVNQAPPSAVTERVGTYVESARLLGERTAAMHRALARAGADQEFAPEPFTPVYQRSLYQSMRNQALETFEKLRKQLNNVPDSLRPLARQVTLLQPEVLKRFRELTEARLTGARIRVHGDYRLGQLLHAGKDFVIIDFEGDPARPLSERRIKRTCLWDVAGLLRSFRYAAHVALHRQVEHGTLSPEQKARLEPWARFWHQWVGVIFFRAYLKTASPSNFLPQTNAEMQLLLEVDLLRRAVADLEYELGHRPDWLRLPCQAIVELLGMENAA